MLLEQLPLGILVVGFVVLFLPILLVMAGVGAAMLLWFVALGALVFWPAFPGTYGFAVLWWLRCSLGCSLSIGYPGMAGNQHCSGATHELSRV